MYAARDRKRGPHLLLIDAVAQRGLLRNCDAARRQRRQLISAPLARLLACVVVVLSPEVLIGSEGSRGVKSLYGACAAPAAAMLRQRDAANRSSAKAKVGTRVQVSEPWAGLGGFNLRDKQRGVKTPPIRHSK